jgi:hypothetical protein
MQLNLQFISSLTILFNKVTSKHFKMSSWNNSGVYDPRYTRYMEEQQYYQEPSRFDPQSSPPYSEVQCKLILSVGVILLMLL